MDNHSILDNFYFKSFLTLKIKVIKKTMIIHEMSSNKKTEKKQKILVLPFFVLIKEKKYLFFLYN